MGREKQGMVVLRRDIITGFKGTIVSRTEYITRCSQLLLVPEGDGKTRVEGEWFDEQGVEREGKHKIVLEPARNAAMPGPDRPAPKR